MNNKNMVNELRALGTDQLSAKANEVAEELMKLRFRKKTGQLTQNHQLKVARRQLARVLTIKSLASKNSAINNSAGNNSAGKNQAVKS